MDYAGLVQNPDAYFTQLIEFLGIQLDIEKMKAVIDPNLYRNRYS
jgi:hypothetical protein